MHDKYGNPKCHLVSDRKVCECSAHCSVGCHNMHASSTEAQRREDEHRRKQQFRDAERAATVCTTDGCQQRKSPSQLRDPNDMITNCHAAQYRDGMRADRGPCEAHWLCLRQPTRQCSFGALYRDASTANHYMPPAHVMTCDRLVCGRINHRFCGRHQGLLCQARHCDQPSVWDEDIRLPSGRDQGRPDPTLQGFCSVRCSTCNKWG